MAIVVEHEKRKHEILDKALDVFVEEGYDDATYQKIADRCGITRTTLYLYFKNKREIFLFSIKQLTSNIETELQKIINNGNLNTEKKLRAIFDSILNIYSDRPRLFTVVLNYLLAMKKTGKNPDSIVRRRTLRLRHLLSTVLIEGMNKGDLNSTNIKAMNEMLYAFIESAVYRISILDQKNVSELREAANLAISAILSHPEEK